MIAQASAITIQENARADSYMSSGQEQEEQKRRRLDAMRRSRDNDDGPASEPEDVPQEQAQQGDLHQFQWKSSKIVNGSTNVTNSREDNPPKMEDLIEKHMHRLLA